MDRTTLLSTLRDAGVSARVLAAIASVPREVFVEESDRDRAWDNEPLAIGGGQTISQPLVVAHMCDLLELRGDERVLDVGTGSGWHCAILARLAGEVVSVERDPGIARLGAEHLEATGVRNVTLVVGDGSDGLPGSGPYDAVNVAACGDDAALTRLEAHLADGGRLVAPVRGAHDEQRLILSRRSGATVVRRDTGRVSFVPLISG